MQAKIFEIADMDLSEFLEEVSDKGPTWIYTYDGEYVLVSDVEIDEDDLESVFDSKISELEDDELDRIKEYYE